MRFKDKVALITGGARGMGAVEARMFAKEGAKVAIADILDKEGGALEKELSKNGHDAVYLHLDVAKSQDWRKAMEAIEKRFGRLNILVNNAGIRGELKDLVNITEEDYDRVLAINAKGTFLGMKYAIPAMRQVGGGAIVNISSLVGIIGSRGRNAAYDASKGATRVMTKTAAITYAKENIRVNSIHPGPIDTPMTEESYRDPEARARSQSRIPLGSIGQSEDVAYAVLFLASDESSYMTGAEIVVDGGMMAY
ncbi:MAG: glucose 1-dehydrogenase [SAR202 cluster bacterium]|nr:glucose 1-dehydrogenase [SAR202 cluster bacterium]